MTNYLPADAYLPNNYSGPSVQSFLETFPKERRDQLLFCRETASTNDDMKRLAREGLKTGTVLFAEKQTGGRGRLTRSFHSPENTGIYLSYYLECPNTEGLTSLTPRVALASLRAIERACCVTPAIKWVNDLVLKDRKIAGILTEIVPLPTGALGTVIGIGMNVNTPLDVFPKELQSKVSSLKEITGQSFDRLALTQALVEELDALARVFPQEDEAQHHLYVRHCLTLGRPVSVNTGSQPQKGVAESLAPDYSLNVRLENGTLMNVVGGEVSVLGLYNSEV